MPKMARAPWWAWTWPASAFAVMIATMVFGAGGAMAALAGAILIAAVFAAVYHAEVVAHRVGEPFGTLMLALAVTIIEVALIVSVMVGVSGNKAGLARDTVFAVVMIVSNVSSASVCYRVECGIESRDFKCNRRTSCACSTHDPDDGCTELYSRHTWPSLQYVAAYLCRYYFTCPLWLIRFRANGAPPRLFSTARRGG